MKLLSRLAPVFAALLIAGCAQSPAKPGDTAFAPADGGFSVQMPATAREQQGKDGSHIYGCEVDGQAYLVGYSELPKVVAAFKADRLLDASRNNLVQSGKAHLINEKKTTIDGRPARDLRLKTKEGYFMRLKLAVSGTRLYQVGAVTSMDQSHAPAIDKFVDSFHFTKQ